MPGGNWLSRELFRSNNMLQSNKDYVLESGNIVWPENLGIYGGK